MVVDSIFLSNLIGERSKLDYSGKDPDLEGKGMCSLLGNFQAHERLDIIQKRNPALVGGWRSD